MKILTSSFERSTIILILWVRELRHTARLGELAQGHVAGDWQGPL